jgi:5'-nucleotidase
MTIVQKRQILLTNDDGIQSPGLWAAASALSELGFVTIAAPREQSSGTGRSILLSSDGKIQQSTLQIGSQEWPVYSVGGTPAQTVLQALIEIMPVPPDLVVVGINYGENVGTCITMSGTVCAAIEAAAQGIPAIAVSLELVDASYLSYSRSVDFSTAAHFSNMFARLILENGLPAGVDLLKVDVPARATPLTPWRLTRLSRNRYFLPGVRRSGSWEEKGRIDYKIEILGGEEAGTDIHALAIDHVVSVTPLSLDMTARVDLVEFEKELKSAD